MTKLLNRGNVFVVVRHVYEGVETHVVGVFSELEEADDYRGVCEQQWREKVGGLDYVSFEVQMTTYYGK
jgi:hypothetical protein